MGFEFDEAEDEAIVTLSTSQYLYPVLYFSVASRAVFDAGTDVCLPVAEIMRLGGEGMLRSSVLC